MVAIKEIISAELQATQFSELKTLPVVDYTKLTRKKGSIRPSGIRPRNSSSRRTFSKKAP